MELINLKVKDFIDEVDSKSPAPGGGSVAALASSLGVGLSRMVGHLSKDRKAFLALDEQIQLDYKINFGLLEELKEKLITLIDLDTAAFNKIMDAYGLPKDSEEAIQNRTKAIEVATLGAINVPFNVATLSLKSLVIIDRMKNYGNKTAVSDIGVAALLIYAGLEGAVLNIKINLSGLSNQEDIDTYQDHCHNLLEQGRKVKEAIMVSVYDKM